MKTVTRTLTIMLLTVLCLSLACIQPARADSLAPGATILVNTIMDEYDTTANGTCSLREAIESANTDADFGGCDAVEPYGIETITFMESENPFQISSKSFPEFGNSTGNRCADCLGAN